MAVVYVREQGAYVRKDGNQLRVTMGKQELITIPLASLEQLILVGNVQMTTPAFVKLIKEEIGLVFMNQYGRVHWSSENIGSKAAKLRHLQLRLCDDEARALAVAQEIVIGKINNQRVILQRRADGEPRIQHALSGMLTMLHSVDNAQNLDQLRGYEGKAAAYYFDGLKTFFPPEWGFKAREYYPPPDPVNALLSFVYTLLRKDIEAKIQIVGLDAYLGFFHALGYNRPALALDLMEEFRPILGDTVILNLVRNGQIVLEDFVATNRSETPIRMNENAMLVLIQAYEDRLQDEIYHPLANGKTDYRRVLELQVRQMARVIQGEASQYEPVKSQ